jgi:hypothetical protein
MDLENRLKNLRIQTEPLERFIHLLANSLDDPELQDKGQVRGFRYIAPGIQHFCLLKAARAVSAFNAAIELCRLGFSQEICVLLRTVVECTSHIDYVLANYPAMTEEVKKYVSDYFSDIERSPTPIFKRPHVRQGAIHDSIGKSLDSVIKTHHAEKYKDVGMSKLYSAVYLNLSNYVHCKYPETMDLYGGRPGKFHLRGDESHSEGFRKHQVA